MAQTSKRTPWYHERKWAAAIAVLALAATYGMASLAIDSGSLFQYFVAVVLLIVAVNRLAHIVIVTFGKKKGGANE